MHHDKTLWHGKPLTHTREGFRVYVSVLRNLWFAAAVVPISIPEEGPSRSIYLSCRRFAVLCFANVLTPALPFHVSYSVVENIENKIIVNFKILKAFQGMQMSVQGPPTGG